jgi:hypothetical protein
MPLFPHPSKATACETRERARARLSVCPIVRRRKCARNQSGNERAEGASIRVDSTFGSTRVRLFFSNRGTRIRSCIQPSSASRAVRRTSADMPRPIASSYSLFFPFVSSPLLSSPSRCGVAFRGRDSEARGEDEHTCFFCFSVFRLPSSVSLVSARRARLRLRL